MKILGIDTTRKSAKILIKKDDEKIIENIDDKIKHSEGVFLYLEMALVKAGLELQDFDYLCGVVGPGSFTGIRVGMSVVKSFAKSLNKKIIPLNTFEIVCKYIKNGVFLLNSTTTNCYYAEIKDSKVFASGVVAKNEISNKFDGKVYVLEEEQNLMDIEYKDINIINNFDDLYFEALDNKLKGFTTEVFEPFYLQLSQAERNING